MKKEECRAVMKHIYLKKWTAAQIKAKLEKVHGDTGFWINKFKRGRTSTKDWARPERPVEVTASQMIENIRRIIIEDRPEIIGISVGAVHNILHEKL